MAKDEMGSIITIGAVGLGAYWLYSSGFLSSLLGSPTAAAVAPAASTPVVAAPPATPNPLNSPAAAVPSWMASLAALGSQLQTMAGSAQQDVDQWSTYYNNLRQQRNMPELTGDQVGAILAVNPATQANRSATIGAPEYVNDIFNLGYGLQGIRRGMGAARRMNPIMRLGYRRVLA